MSTWFFTTFNVSGLKEKVHYLDGLQQLFTCIRPEQIDIPPFVLEYDARVSVHTWAALLCFDGSPTGVLVSKSAPTCL